MLFCALTLSLAAKDRPSVVGEFLALPYGERAIAMGEAGGALATDVTPEKSWIQFNRLPTMRRG